MANPGNSQETAAIEAARMLVYALETESELTA